MQFMKELGVFEEVDVDECWKRNGRAPTSTRWIDINKGTEDEPVVRCRLVARDFKVKGERDREDLFAATPPLEAKKMLFRMARVKRRMRPNESGGKGKLKVMYTDVKKAPLNAKLKEDEDEYIELPEKQEAKRVNAGG